MGASLILSLRLLKQHSLFIDLHLSNTLTMYSVTTQHKKKSVYDRLLQWMGLKSEPTYKVISLEDSYLLKLIGNTPLVVSLKNAEGKYVMVNDAFSDLFGVSNETVVGKSDVELKLFLNPLSVWESDKKVIETGSKHSIPIEPITDKYGDLYWFETQRIPIRTEESEILIATFSRDVTKKVEREQKLLKSEVRYKTIFENNYSGIIVIDKELKIYKKNRAFNDLVGLDKRKLEQDDLSKYLNAEDVRDLKDLLGGLITRNYEFFDLQMEVSTVNNDIVYTNCFVRGIFNERNEFTEAVVTFQDITKELQHLREIEDSEERFRTIVENAPEALLILDYDKQQYIDANKNAEKLFGYTRKEITALKVGDLSPMNQSSGDDSKKLAYDYITKAIAGESVTYEWIVQRKDGKLVPVEVRFVRLPYSDRTILRSSVIDITERKKAEHLLNSEKKKLQESNTELIALNHQLEEQTKQLQEFAYISSHNLRSPAGNIRALLNFYLSDPTETNLELFLSKLDTVSQDLLETINDLSEVVKIKNEQNKDVVLIDLDKMLDKAKNSLSEEIQKTKAIISADFSAAHKIASSKAYVESIFLNLLSNSLKYNNPKVPLKIDIKSEVTEDSFILSFTDNGLGLDLKKFGQKVFGLRKTFHRGKDSRGVGLFLTKAQVEAMGGFISLESEPLKGCTFSINLPKSILA